MELSFYSKDDDTMPPICLGHRTDSKVLADRQALAVEARMANKLNRKIFLNIEAVLRKQYVLSRWLKGAR